MKRLWPKAHFNPIKKDEYNENCINYAQKNDDTTEGHHVNTINDPLPANDTLLYKVLEKAVDHLIHNTAEWSNRYQKSAEDIVFHAEFSLSKLKTRDIERSMVMERAGLEKIFCSPAYEKMKQTFYPEIIYRILKTQRQDAEETKVHDERRSSEEKASDGDSEDYEECESEADEGSDESTDDQASEDFD